MAKLLTLLFLYFLSLLGVNSDYCEPHYVLGDFPEDIMKDMHVAATTGDVPDFSGCHDDVTIDRRHVVLWYNGKANNESDPIPLDYNNPKEIDLTKPIVFLIHGWLCNVTSDLMPELKDAYFKRYGDINVIRVEWNKYATDRYAKSFCYIPKIAEVLGEFICKLHHNAKVNLDKVHIVGHSMGAQISGITGKQVQKQCNQVVGRITGLDPAGPLFQKADNAHRLHKTDSKVVVVIHTNQEQLGFHGSCGTVDFYPNCGFFQPNSMKLLNSTKIDDMRPLPLDTLLRNHLLAAEYMVESILFDSFKATPCSNCHTPTCVEDRGSGIEIFMGEYHPEDTIYTGNYLVNTNGIKPFNREFGPNRV